MMESIANKSCTVTKEKDVLHVWDFWNECSIIKHRRFDKFAPCIRGALTYYSVSELCQAMRNYKDILVSERHWFSYAWSLDQFLGRKNALDSFLDREVALTKYSRTSRAKFEDDSVEDDGADFYRAIANEEFNAPEVKDVHK